MTNTNTAQDTLAAIAALLSGQEWDVDTLMAIADLVRAAGFEIADVSDEAAS